MATSTDRVKAYANESHFVVTRYADGAISGGDVVAAGTNSGEVATATSGDNPYGIAVPATVGSDDHEDGDQVPVLVSGVALVEADAAITAGEVVKVASGTDGAVGPITGDGTDAASTHLGKALEDASDGDRFEVKLY